MARMLLDHGLQLGLGLDQVSDTFVKDVSTGGFDVEDFRRGDLIDWLVRKCPVGFRG